MKRVRLECECVFVNPDDPKAKELPCHRLATHMVSRVANCETCYAELLEEAIQNGYTSIAQYLGIDPETVYELPPTEEPSIMVSRLERRKLTYN